MLTIHGMPNRSVSMPSSSPHICLSRGIVTAARCDIPPQEPRSASASLPRLGPGARNRQTRLRPLPTSARHASIDPMTTVYEAVGGEAGLRALAGAWHARCLADPVASHPFSHGGLHPAHVERLAAYWGEALGGPTTFTDSMNDEAAVLRMHAGNGTHRELDALVVDLFDAAMDDVGLTDHRVRTVLHDYFAWSTDRMGGHPDSPDSVADDVRLPHWDWDGPVPG
jgi:hemoglobin